jgi:hypothetical protein
VFRLVIKLYSSTTVTVRNEMNWNEMETPKWDKSFGFDGDLDLRVGPPLSQ